MLSAPRDINELIDVKLALAYRYNLKEEGENTQRKKYTNA